MTKDEAQRRADRIRAFRAELRALATEGVETLSDERAAAIAAHHDALLGALAARYDIDRTETGRRMSLGLRLASAFGAAALTAAIVSFFYRIWGALATPAQVGLVTAAPIAALAAMVAASRRERTLYVASLCAIVACGAFVLQTMLLGQLFNLRGSAHVLLAWAVFGLAVSLPFRFVLPFAASVGAAITYAAALLATVAGAPWHDFAWRLESVLAPAVLACAAWGIVPLELQPWMRGVTLGLALAALLGLSTFESPSVLPFAASAVSVFYQVGAAVVAFAVVAHGLRTGRSETIAVGAAFGGMFLLGRFVDWWWDWMPKYLFFLILAVVAMTAIGLLRRLRARLAEAV